ncbi:MAG: AI-2E family transporter [Parcubacteria group bacterium]|nr:AI-2E family transporter [Parcubacteria group bacterium]
MSNIIVNINAASFFKAILVVLFFVALYVLRDLVLVLLTSVVIASAIEPMTKWFVNHKLPRVIAVIFIYLAFAIVLVGIFYLFLPPLLNETSGLVSSLPEYITSLPIFDPGNVQSGFSAGQQFVEGLSGDFSLGQAVSQIQNVASRISDGLFQSLSTIFGGLLSFILIIVISFYLSVQEKGIENFLRLVTPLSQEKYIIGLWQRSQMKIGRWMQGQLLLGLIVGVLVYLGLTILGVPYALLLAVLAALFEIIPLFGPILASIPAIALGFTNGASLGLMVIGLYVIIQQFENHLIYPLVVRKVVGVSPILVIIALVVGAQLAGFLGILLAVPVAAAIVEFVDDIQRKKIEEEKRLSEKEK